MAYVTVIGAANIDIGGASNNTLIPRDSNVGTVTMSLGGVARNIAANLCLLGCETKFISLFGEDDFAGMLRADAARIGLDISGCAVIRGAKTSTYLFINDEQGDMHIAVSDMSIYSHITPEFLRGRMDTVNGSALVVVDTNIPQESLQYLCENCAAPILVDPVSTVKAKKLLPVLGKLHAIKPNRIEAQTLTGIDCSDEDGVRRAAERLLELGVRNVVISLSVDGVFACNAKGETARVRPPRFDAVSTTGGGDALAAGLAVCMMRGDDLATSARCALAAGTIACESARTINPDMSFEAVMKRAESM
ncbi:MAG: bifunctional hydroxymethylpyrimidine kinase/phosphomethylpyrimidine kinase [Oscillospiraceae bacterium]|nr:bifunctional hydroxymethylpyrimidine kinase/phosphomethylpyrimidine kinase [Oscillospiraceae bacterium]